MKLQLPHTFFTPTPGILDDTVIAERTLGINAGLVWANVADKHVFYIDYGMSKGMEYALEYAVKNNIAYEFRRIKG